MRKGPNTEGRMAGKRREWTLWPFTSRRPRKNGVGTAVPDLDAKLGRNTAKWLKPKLFALEREIDREGETRGKDTTR